MHRSSESVSAIATALAKAQTELSNPEKAMVGMVYSNRSDSLQSFRYASLSSGLDIVRETLGGQQIAVALFEPAAKMPAAVARTVPIPEKFCSAERCAIFAGKLCQPKR